MLPRTVYHYIRNAATLLSNQQCSPRPFPLSRSTLIFFDTLELQPMAARVSYTRSPEMQSAGDDGDGAYACYVRIEQSKHPVEVWSSDKESVQVGFMATVHSRGVHLIFYTRSPEPEMQSADDGGDDACFRRVSGSTGDGSYAWRVSRPSFFEIHALAGAGDAVRRRRWR